MDLRAPGGFLGRGGSSAASDTASDTAALDVTDVAEENDMTESASPASAFSARSAPQTLDLDEDATSTSTPADVAAPTSDSAADAAADAARAAQTSEPVEAPTAAPADR